MIMEYFNIAPLYLFLISLFLGMVSWILPIIAIKFLKRKNYKMVRNFSIVSLGLTTLAISIQYLYIDYLVYKDNLSALYDTNSALLFCITVLITITFLLNFINMLFVKINNKINKENK